MNIVHIRTVLYQFYTGREQGKTGLKRLNPDYSLGFRNRVQTFIFRERNGNLC